MKRKQCTLALILTSIFLPRQWTVAFAVRLRASILLRDVLRFPNCAFWDFLQPFYVVDLETRPDCRWENFGMKKSLKLWKWKVSKVPNLFQGRSNLWLKESYWKSYKKMFKISWKFLKEKNLSSVLYKTNFFASKKFYEKCVKFAWNLWIGFTVTNCNFLCF